MGYELIELTEEQKKIVRDNYANKTLSELTQLCFPDAKDSDGRPVDGRTTEGKSVRAYITTLGVTVKTNLGKVSQPPLILTDEQKRFIEKNHHAFEGKIVELIRTLFKNDTLVAISREGRAVYAYLKEVYPAALNSSEEPVEDEHYELPGSITLLVGEVNRYVHTGDLNRKLYQWGNLKPSQERCLRSLMSYVRNYRFTYQANQYDKQADRELFISTFMRFAHDKPDLTEMEVDQTISAATETVNIAQIERSIKRIDKMQEEIIEGLVTDANGKVQKLSMSDVELVNSVRTKHDAAKARLQKFMADLETTRSKRQSDKDSRNSSILNLLEAWQNDEQKRQDLIDTRGVTEKEEDKKEFGRIRDFDDITAIIAGQSQEEAMR